MTLYRHSYIGSLPAGDIFVFNWMSSNSLSVGGSNANAVTWLTNLMNGTGGASGIKGHMTTGVVFNTVKTAAIDTVTHKQTALVEATVANAGTDAGTSCPQQIAVVCSLRTALPNRQGRGRMFLPPPAVSALAATGLLATASRDDYVNSLKQAWAVADAAGEAPITWSKKGSLLTPNNELMVGTVLNSQDRRINKLVTARNSATLP